MSVIDKLLILQEHDSRIRELEKEMKDIPARKEEEKSRLNSHKQALVESEEDLKKVQADLKQLELDGQALSEKVNKLRQQQLELKTNKEFRAMEEEIKAVLNETSVLEDKELSLMDEIEGATQNVEEKKVGIAKEESEIASDIKILDQRVAEASGQVKELQELRKAAVVDVDSDWLVRYEGIFAKKDRALVSIEDGVCGGCHMQLPRFIIHDAKKQKGIISCQFCGRMLY